MTMTTDRQALINDGWTAGELDRALGSGCSIWPIKVVPTCSCPNCATGGRWFNCTGDRRVEAVYLLVQDGRPKPTDENIRPMFEAHPGCALIF